MTQSTVRGLAWAVDDSYRMYFSDLAKLLPRYQIALECPETFEDAIVASEDNWDFVLCSLYEGDRPDKSDDGIDRAKRLVSSVRRCSPSAPAFFLTKYVEAPDVLMDRFILAKLEPFSIKSISLHPGWMAADIQRELFRHNAKGTQKDSVTWDVFISHASEDKEIVALPLAAGLKRAGFSVWFDAFTLKLGDSLRRTIDEGITKSRYGIVVLSPSFFMKQWPQRELDALTSVEMSRGKTILPIWHRVNHSEILAFSPVLADRFAVTTQDGMDEVIRQILRVLRAIDPIAAPQHSADSFFGDHVWIRPKHEILRYLHIRVIIPRYRHNPIMAPFRSLLASPPGGRHPDEISTEQGLVLVEPTSLNRLNEAITAAEELLALVKAAYRLLAFSPGHGMRDERFGKDLGAGTLAADAVALLENLTSARANQSVSGGSLYEIKSLVDRISRDFYSDESLIKKTLMSYVVSLPQAVLRALEVAESSFQRSRSFLRELPSWKEMVDYAHGLADTAQQYLVLVDRALLYELLINVFTNLRHAEARLTSASGMTLELRIAPVQADHFNEESLEVEVGVRWQTGGTPFTAPSPGSTFQLQREDLREFGGDLFFAQESGRLTVRLHLISWNHSRYVPDQDQIS